MKPDRHKERPTFFRASDEVLREIAILAAMERRSKSNMTAILVEEALKARAKKNGRVR